MCTSFIYRNDSKIIGMNFDNNGMRFNINTSRPGWFTVDVDGGRGKYPSFGVSRKGEFFNNLMVDSNGKGLYRRPSKKVTHTTKLITDLLDGKIAFEKLSDYLQEVEVVNTPDWSCHNMIADADANVWIVEPGRENLYSASESTPYYVMTNFSLCDYQKVGGDSGCSRFQEAIMRLNKAENFTVDEAFSLLAAVSQHSDEWKTDFTMVYAEQDQKVYYCLNSNFNERFEFSLT